MTIDAHSRNAIAATLASQIGFAVRNVRKFYKGQSCPQAIEQTLAAFGFGLQSLRRESSCEEFLEPMVPVLVPLSLAETILQNVQSWAMHQDDVNVVGHPVHYASVAALAAHQVAQRDPAAYNDRLIAHRRAARKRHNVKPSVVSPPAACSPQGSPLLSASRSGPAALALASQASDALARRCAIRRASTAERARSLAESSEHVALPDCFVRPGDKHQMLRLESKIDSIKFMVSDLTERFAADSGALDLLSQSDSRDPAGTHFTFVHYDPDGATFFDDEQGDVVTNCNAAVSAFEQSDSELLQSCVEAMPQAAAIARGVVTLEDKDQALQTADRLIEDHGVDEPEQDVEAVESKHPMPAVYSTSQASAVLQDVASQTSLSTLAHTGTVAQTADHAAHAATQTVPPGSSHAEAQTSVEADSSLSSPSAEATDDASDAVGIKDSRLNVEDLKSKLSLIEVAVIGGSRSGSELHFKLDQLAFRLDKVILPRAEALA